MWEVALSETLNTMQSINQSVNPSINQSIDRSIKQSINQIINHSINQSVYLDEKYLYLSSCSVHVYTLVLDSSNDILLRDLWPNCPLHTSWYKQNQNIVVDVRIRIKTTTLIYNNLNQITTRTCLLLISSYYDCVTSTYVHNATHNETGILTQTAKGLLQSQIKYQKRICIFGQPVFDIFLECLWRECQRNK